MPRLRAWRFSQQRRHEHWQINCHIQKCVVVHVGAGARTEFIVGDKAIDKALNVVAVEFAVRVAITGAGRAVGTETLHPEEEHATEGISIDAGVFIQTATLQWVFTKPTN